MDTIEDINKLVDELNIAEQECNDLAEVIQFQEDRFKPFDEIPGIDLLVDKQEGIEQFIKHAEEARTIIEDLEQEGLFVELNVREDLQKEYDNKMSDAVRQHEADQAAMSDQIDQADQFLWNSVIGDEFRTSSYFNGHNPKTILPNEIAISMFIDHFSVEANDKGYPICVAYENGNRMVTKEKNKLSLNTDLNGSRIIETVPSRPMTFNEAMGVLVSKRPDIMRAGLHGSGGVGGNTSPGETAANVLNRQYRDFMSKGNVSAAIAIKNRAWEKKR